MMEKTVIPFQLWVEIGVWDKSGKLIHKQRELSRSPVQQFLELLLAQMSQSNVLTVVDTTGNLRTVSEHEDTFDIKSSTSWLWGIVIGTDATAVDITDYQLGAQVTTGWVYGAPAIPSAVTVADPDCSFETSRNFNNNSGSSVDIKETGIYCKGMTFYFLIIRDVPTLVTVPDGGGCYVKYTLKITE